jgi:uncharacterized protein
VDLHASSFILGEVGRIFAEKFGWEQDRVERAISQIRRVAGGIHEPAESLDVIEDDPTDNRILECALAAGAQLIVTGDRKHLLPLGSFRGCRSSRWKTSSRPSPPTNKCLSTPRYSC